MPRRRLTDHHLPERVYFHEGKYRYRESSGKWHTLGVEWDRAAREEYDRVTRGTAEALTVAALLDAFLLERERQVRAGIAAKRTLEDNEGEAVQLRMVFGRMPVTAVTSQHAAMYLRKRTDKKGKPAPVRANREIALLSSAYAWGMGLAEWGIERNPCYGVRRNQERPRKRYVETSELAVWKRTAPKWLRAYVLLKRLTGARQGEMLTLKRTDLTDKGIKFGITKTGRVKIVRWSWALRVTVDVIMSLHKPNLPVQNLFLFITRDNSGMGKRGFKSAWSRAMKRYVMGISITEQKQPFREHDLRAKTASDMSLGRAQELLDHASPSMTRDYQRAPAKVRPLR